MKFLYNNSTDPYFNMAFDEFCLQEFGEEGPFFYLWRDRPSVIIGLNQNAYAEVNTSYIEDNGILLARRVTGGGAVYHDLQNMNYSIIGHSVTPEPFVQALRELGVPAELTGRNDIFVDGRKVSGYARRVWRDREIVHGTMMYDVDIETLTAALSVPGSKMEAKGIASVRSRVANLKDFLPQFGSLDEVQESLRQIMAGNDECLHLTPEQLTEVRRIADEKFSTWEWVYGRSRELSTENVAKLPCGTVSLGVKVDGGRIVELSFAGDFMDAKPASELAKQLHGVVYSRAGLLDALSRTDVGAYFPGTTVEQLADLILNQHSSIICETT